MSMNDLERERIERSIALLSKASPRPLSDLIPYERNQKNHDERQIANVANSLRRFGWRQPIVVDARNVIVIGHCRVLAAKQLGLDSAPCIDAADLSEDEIRELRIVDNKTNESAWNDYLNTDIQELDFDGFDFDFDDGETGGVCGHIRHQGRHATRSTGRDNVQTRRHLDVRFSPRHVRRRDHAGQCVRAA